MATREHLPKMPIEPIRDLVARLIEREQADHTRENEKWNGHGGATKSLADICLDLGLSERQWLRWRTEQKYIKFDQADRILLRTDLHWWDVWPEEKYPEIYARLSE